jgi:23S rRNA pseudouridine2605 synthase
MLERLQKIISRAGITSRRKAELLIQSGHVTVNEVTVTELGAKADLDTDDIRVDGRRLKPPTALHYVALYKPRDIVTTMHDPERRRTVADLVSLPERVYPVGRLDYASEGLILLTNDGDFANLVMAKASKVEKVYHAKVTGQLTDEQLEEFRAGVPMFGRKTAPAQIQLIRRGDNPWYEVILTEGRNQQVRVMFQHFGLLVERLRRVRIGFLELGELNPGDYRPLSEKEIHRFQAMLAGEAWALPKKPAAKKVDPREVPALRQEFARKMAAKKAARPAEKRPGPRGAVSGPRPSRPDSRPSRPDSRPAARPARKFAATESRNPAPPPRERPANSAPATKRPTTQRPAAKRPTTQSSADQPPVSKRPATKRPATKRPATKRPAAKSPTSRIQKPGGPKPYGSDSRNPARKQDGGRRGPERKPR